MKDFFNIKKTGTALLWFWGVFGLYTGLFAILEGRVGVGIFITATAVLAFYAIWQKKRKKPSDPSIDEKEQK